MISTYASKYCSEPLENIENYEQADADKEHLWHCHHRLEVQGQFRNSKELLKRCGMYWHRPASELIFLREDVHISLHNKGKHLSEEHRRKISESHPTKKMVEMTRKSDGFTMRFPSHSEAARYLRENGFPRAVYQNITKCCRGIIASAYGCSWRYV